MLGVPQLASRLFLVSVSDLLNSQQIWEEHEAQLSECCACHFSPSTNELHAQQQVSPHPWASLLYPPPWLTVLSSSLVLPKGSIEVLGKAASPGQVHTRQPLQEKCPGRFSPGCDNHSTPQKPSKLVSKGLLWSNQPIHPRSPSSSQLLSLLTSSTPPFFMSSIKLLESHHSPIPSSFIPLLNCKYQNNSHSLALFPSPSPSPSFFLKQVSQRTYLKWENKVHNKAMQTYSPVYFFSNRTF